MLRDLVLRLANGGSLTIREFLGDVAEITLVDADGDTAVAALSYEEASKIMQWLDRELDE